MGPPGVLFVANISVWSKKLSIVHMKYANIFIVEVKISDARVN